jgi:hypothetical protein
MNEFVQELGQKLVEESSVIEEFSAQRGLIDELFPYVFEASKRMSSRAISRWLSANNVKLSAATIAKALRNPEPYWQELADEIEIHATIFAGAHNVEVKELLERSDLFECLCQESHLIAAGTQEGAMKSYDEIEAAKSNLDQYWFSLPESARETCLGHADLDYKQDNEAQAPADQPQQGEKPA